MFGWLRRFDDWLEQKDREANPRYVPQSYTMDIETDPIDDEEPKYDWEARRKAVEVLVKAEARIALAKFAREHMKAAEAFTSWAAINGSHLIVCTPSGRYSVNMDFLLTVKLDMGKEVSSNSDHVYVTYNKKHHRVTGLAREVGFHRDFPDERYYNRQWPRAAVDDAITFIGVEGQRIEVLAVPQGRGEDLHSQIMDAIGGRSK